MYLLYVKKDTINYSDDDILRIKWQTEWKSSAKMFCDEYHIYENARIGMPLFNGVGGNNTLDIKFLCKICDDINEYLLKNIFHFKDNV